MRLFDALFSEITDISYFFVMIKTPVLRKNCLHEQHLKCAGHELKVCLFCSGLQLCSHVRYLYFLWLHFQKIVVILYKNNNRVVFEWILSDKRNIMKCRRETVFKLELKQFNLKKGLLYNVDRDICKILKPQKFLYMQ